MRQFKVILVDDEAPVLRAFEDYFKEDPRFKQTPLNLTTCSTIEDAKKLLATNHFDVLVSDLKLPGGRGTDLLDMLPSRDNDEEHEKTLFILISGFLDRDVSMNAMERGAFACLKKPFHLDTLGTVILNAIHKIRLAAASEDTL